MVDLPLDGTRARIWLQIVDLQTEWSHRLAILGALSGIMSNFPTTEIGIFALTIFTYRAGHDIFDLSGGL